MVFLACWSAAHAFTSQQSGPGLDVGVGLGLGGAPASAHVGGVIDAGWWVGRYDDQYSLGRYWWVGPTFRFDWRPDGVRLAPMVEVRRGIDLLVVGVAPLVTLGPVFAGDEISYAGRAGLFAKFRRTRSFGWFLRLEAGADVSESGQARFAGGVLLGGAWSRPVRRQVSDIE